MLKIQKDHFDFPHIIEHIPSLHLRPLQLSPIKDDDDDLTQAIKSDPQVHDDIWELSERPNADELTAFWNQVADEAKKDPDWTFDE